jgi:tetratricopeptide (TPR) repeat protein
LFSQFNGYAIPLLVFLNGKGEELDRVVGYRDVDEFLSILNNVLNNQDTFMSLSKQYNEGNRKIDLIDKLSLKSEERQDDELSSELYTIVLDRVSEFDLKIYERAQYHFAKSAIKNDDISKILSFIEEYKNSENITSAYFELIKFYASKNDTTFEVKTYKNMIKKHAMLDSFDISRRSSLLNSYAWRMTELESNLEDALLKSIYSIKIVDSLGIDISSRKPMLLDTKAEILWKMNRIDEAINTINQAIEMDPKYQYYQDQKTKFENSKKGN